MNNIIQQSLELTKTVLMKEKEQNHIVACSVSGGADSDILIDLCERTVPHYVNYVFFNTGIEYQATKDHLDWLEEYYNISIKRYNAKVPVPLGNKKYGVPFLSKQVSEYIARLQRNNFEWKDDSFEELYKKYPNCKSALTWWCNQYGDKSSFNICRNTWLKEYLIKNPPKFRISNKCCDGAKKHTSDYYMREYSTDLFIIGIRKAEGGQRATRYSKQYYYNKQHKVNHFLPILYFTDDDRKEYEDIYGVVHSNCYTEYGLKRTGCAGCPYGQNYNFERKTIEDHEPKLSKAITNMWSQVYDYTDKYHEFQRLMNLKYKANKKCNCGCTEFDGDTVAMNLKFLGRNATKIFCKKCLQEKLKMTNEEWNQTIKDFKTQGCALF